MTPFYENNSYFWLCDDCKAVHMWTYEPEYFYRRFEIKKKLDDISVDEIKELNEYLVVNINAIDDEFDSTPIKDLMVRSTINQFKYFATDDLTKVYIIDINKNKLDSEYELTYESSLETDLKIDSFGDIMIYTIEKKNNGHEYVVENGVRKQQDDDKYPHFQVNFMIHEDNIGFADPKREPETYNKDTIDEFYKKYGNLYKKRKFKYFYVEYLDMVEDKLYCYKSSDDYRKGDIVLVPRGYNDEEVKAKIINIKEYTEENAPYPYDDLKFIIDYADD